MNPSTFGTCNVPSTPPIAFAYRLHLDQSVNTRSRNTPPLLLSPLFAHGDQYSERRRSSGQVIRTTCDIPPSNACDTSPIIYNSFSRHLRKSKRQHVLCGQKQSTQLFMSSNSDYNQNNKGEPREQKQFQGQDSDNDDYNIHDDDNKVAADHFLNFDDEDFLEELLVLADESPLDIDIELEELERLIDEQGWEIEEIDEIEERSKMDLDVSMQEDMPFRQDSVIKITSPGAAAAAVANTSSDVPLSTTLSDSDDDDDDNIDTSETVDKIPSSIALEQALMQGVVPASAGVGSNCLPGDYGFDPLGLSKKDYFKQVQNFLLNFIPPSSDFTDPNESADGSGEALPRYAKSNSYVDTERPPALILRDYREIEIRHGRLAMLASLLWPLQEIIDRLFIPESFGHTTFVYGGTTLPFVSLFMTLNMMLLGYLDIYAASIKDIESGDAFLPGECFWDPLKILDGAPESMKRNMQARELNNGRMAMIAVLLYIIQEGITHQPVISLPWNQVLFEPAFEIPEVQKWLDGQFAGPTFMDGISVDTDLVPAGSTTADTEIWTEVQNDVKI